MDWRRTHLCLEHYALAFERPEQTSALHEFQKTERSHQPDEARRTLNLSKNVSYKWTFYARSVTPNRFLFWQSRMGSDAKMKTSEASLEFIFKQNVHKVGCFWKRSGTALETRKIARSTCKKGCHYSFLPPQEVILSFSVLNAWSLGLWKLHA